MKLKKINRTRCYECWTRLEFSDDELADEVIAKHLLKNCSK